MDEPLSDNGSEGHGGFDEGDEEIDLTAAPAGGLQDGAGAMGEKPKKKERDRKAEAAANKVVADIAVGFRDFDDMEKCEKVSEVLIRALSQHDPDFKRKMAASDILEALKAGLKDQKGGPEVSFVRRAIVGQVSVGVAQRKYTASMVGDLLGVDRKRVNSACKLHPRRGGKRQEGSRAALRRFRGCSRPRPARCPASRLALFRPDF